MEPDEENGVDSHSSESEDEDYHPNAEPAESNYTNVIEYRD